MQGLEVLDGGVGGHHPDHGLRIGLRHEQRGRGHGGGGVAADRLEHDARAVDPGGAELLGDQEAVLGVAHHDRVGEAGAPAAQRGFHDHGAVMVEQAPELLGEALARHRPQPRSGAAGQDDGHDVASIRRLARDQV